MANKNGWDDALEAEFSRLWKAGHKCKDIAKALGKSTPSIRNYASRHRERLGLEVRDGNEWKNWRVIKNPTELDREWLGAVPFGHWTITKPWGTGHAQTASF